MPFDCYSYLVSQGWSGRGNGLRQGSLSKPIVPRQRKGQAGVGVDRDDATPFWDHIFAATAQSIRIDVSNSDSDDESADQKAKFIKADVSADLVCQSSKTESTLKVSDPFLDDFSPSIMLLATDKRNAARKDLYARFSRGPTLGPMTTLDENHALDRRKSLPERADSELTELKQSELGSSEGYKLEKTFRRAAGQDGHSVKVAQLNSSDAEAEEPRPKGRRKKKRKKD